MSAYLLKLETAPDLVDRVHRSLLDAISDGTLAPGSRITQEEVAAQLAVSRQPVLQALRLLKKDGFVTDAPGRGLQVSALDEDFTRKLYQVRCALDSLAARPALGRCALDSLAARLAAQRRFAIDERILDNGRKAARGRNVQAMIDADLAFHHAIYAASGNPLIEQSAQLHWRHLRRVMGAVLQQARQRETVWDEHEQIARAIAAGNADKAARLIEGHGANAGENLAQRLGHVLKTQGDKR
jgi:DNA-binding GntR family transcriptional regulator